MGGGAPDPPTHTTETVTSEPPDYVKRYIKRGLHRADKLMLQDRRHFYPGQTYVDPSPETLAALDMQTDRALHGSPLDAAGQGQALATARGDYFDAGNPYADELAESVTSRVLPQIDSQFAGAGRYGSAAHTEAAARGLGDALAPNLFGFASQERGRMLDAAKMSPFLAQTDYQDIGQLAQAGQAREAIDNRALQDDIARFEFEQNEPYSRILPFTELAYRGAGTGGTQMTSATNPAAYSYGPGPLDYLGAGVNTIGSFLPLLFL